jgi:PAS domain S-box-containing protein
MSEGDLARATLDTFPINVAVVDGDGHIVLTNRAWQAFARQEGDVEDHEELGTNYLTAATVDDDDAEAAVAGLRAVVDGDREQFELEYPCHSPDERRWFIMRVSPVVVDGERGAVVAHANITDRKEAELAADERADQLEHLLERVDGLITEATTAVVAARSRPAIEAALCEAVVGTDPYRFAWVGRPDLRAESLVPRAWSGDGPDDVEARSLSLSTDAPAARAYHTGELQVVTDVAVPDPDDERDRTGSSDRDAEADDQVATDGATAVADDPDGSGWGPVPDARAVAAVPLSYRETTYGVLSVSADRADAFDAYERTVLAALGNVVATAVHAVTSGRVLERSTVVEFEVAVEAPGSYLTALPGEEETLRHQDAHVDDDGTVRTYATVDGDAGEVIARAREHPDVEDARVLAEYEGSALFELAVGTPLVASLADFDGATTALSATGGTVTTTVSFPDETAARAAFEHLGERYDRVDLVAYRERDRATDTAAGFRAGLEDALTDRQLTALRMAYYSGYFEWPRDVSGEEVADAMGITRATFHQHLREAQRKLASALLEPGQ